MKLKETRDHEVGGDHEAGGDHKLIRLEGTDSHEAGGDHKARALDPPAFQQFASTL